MAYLLLTIAQADLRAAIIGAVLAPLLAELDTLGLYGPKEDEATKGTP